MGYFGKKRKKFLALAIALSLQMQAVLPCYAAVAAEAGGENVSGNVINIVKPDSNGLSHNKFTDFNVDANGVVFNNHTGNAQYNSKLAGALNANANLQGNAAKLILTEVTGTGKTNLNGMLEIAGAKADLVIANPNGIVGNGFGFINVNRASLVAGRPDFVNGNLAGYKITNGEVTIGEQGNNVIFDVDGSYKYDNVNKLDIMARAIKINGELWAKNEINIVTGSNDVKYNADGSLAVQQAAASGVKPQLALDVAALGGMYAGKIMLVGTEKGLGMNIGGNLKAQDNLSITNDGKIVFSQNGSCNVDDTTHKIQDADYTSVTSDGTATITSTDDIENKGVVTAQKDMSLTVGGKLVNSGTLEAGAAYTQNDTEDNPTFLHDAAELKITANEISNSGSLSASKTLNVTSTTSINNNGYMHSSGEASVTAGGILSGAGSIGAASSVSIEADKLTLNKNNIYTVSADGKINNTSGVSITERNPAAPVTPVTPDPEEPREAENFTAPVLPDVAEAPGTASTIKKDKIKDEDLALVADAANGKYKPIIDKTANGVDLVQIAEVNSNGVSRNLYSDFNIKSTGLILNNATKYTKTELGGYIDRNMFLAGQGARVILNEVTSSHASTLNGYLEVAGHQASVVIANANGISVNGLGFINTDNVIISTGAVTNWADGNVQFSESKGDMLISGDGLNARKQKQLAVFAKNLNVEQSELYANELQITAAGLLQNTGKIAATENMQLNAAELKNSNLGYIEAQKNLTAKVAGDVEQDKATLKAGSNLQLRANALKNTNNSLLSAANNADINITTSIDNAKAIILAGQNIDVRAADFTNQDTALVNYGQNGSFAVSNKFANDGATISADSNNALTKIMTTDFSNTNKGALVSKGALQLAASSTLNNNNANIYVTGTGEINTGLLLNSNLANLHTGGAAKITANSLQNSKASIDVQGALQADLGSFTNQDSAYLGVGRDAVITTANAFTNKELGNIFVTKDLTVNSTGDFLNEDGLLAIGGSAAISAKNITNQNKAGIKQGSLINAVGDLSLTAEDTVLNRSSDIESEGNITIKAKNLVNKKELFKTSFKESHEDISYKIPHLDAPNYYDAVRKFDRQILTAQIDEETADANIIASGNININLDNDLTNHYSKIKAGKALTVNAGGTVENVGYQGTIHYYDSGNDYHYWKYKKHRRFHISCRWVYGTTVIPYYDHTMRDEAQAEGSERLSLLSGVTGVSIEAGNIINRTHQAEGKVDGLPESDAYFKTDSDNHLLSETEYKEKQDVSTSVDGRADDKNAASKDNATAGKMLDISSLHINSKIYKLTEAASAKYLIETNKKFADYHEFLSSDYLLERVKADPEKVGKRLGDGYFEQQFVLQQIGTLTGKKYLGDYGSDMEQFAALMNAGAVIAEEMNLKVGVALTAEQMASLTTDIVWLVEEEVNGQKVLVPEVFLAQVRQEDLRPSGALIIGGEVELYAKQNIKNMGNIKSDGTVALRAENVSNKGDIAAESLSVKAEKNITNSGTMRAKVDALLQAENITNEAATSETQYRELNQKTITSTGSISAGNNLTLEADKNITNKGANLSAGKDLSLSADNIDIVTVAKEKHVAVAYGSSAAEIHDVQHQQSALSGENIRLKANKDISIAGGVLSAAKDVELQAEGDVSLTAVKDIYSEESEVGSRGGRYYNHNKKVDEAVKSTTIAAKNDVAVASGNDIKIKGSNVTSEAGKVRLDAENNIDITNETEYHERLHEYHSKVSGALSSKTTDIYDYSNQNTVIGSSLSADEIAISSKKNTNITGSSVVADNDVSIKAGGDLNISSAEQTSDSLYVKQVKKSGVLAGGGLGFTIGKEKRKDQYADQNVEQVASTVGSIKGNVNLTAEKNAQIKGSNVLAGKNISIKGENVNVENSDSIYNAQEKHEFERTGLSVSVGGNYVAAADNVVNSVKHAAEVEDKRLGALVAAKGYKDTAKAVENIKGNNNGKVKDNLSLNVSLGSTKSSSESNSTTTVANASEVKAGGDVSIVSTKKDINITGSNVAAKNVKLDARENLNISASKNTNKTEQSSKASSASVGASISTSGTGYNIAGSMSRGEVSANGISYNESNVKAEKDLTFASGKDTNIKGGVLQGEKVTGTVGHDLNIESKQDSNSYKESNKTAGASIGLSDKTLVGNASSGKIDSNYTSVTDQSGIYAGSQGFDIGVGKNTDLKGGIISSEAGAEKNKLSTGTLTFEDLENKADYKASSVGVSANINNKAEYNEKGVTPNIGMPASGEAESKTKATISEGTIEIRDKENQKQDINELNRDTNNSLNKLGEIFDKTKIEERQELANLFGELAYNEIHRLADKNGWKEGSAEKNALHALVGGIMSELTGNGFLTGASASAINEMVQQKLAEQFKDEPDKHQWASAIIGGVVSQLVAGKAQAGASTAASGTKNNFLSLNDYQKYLDELDAIENNDSLSSDEKHALKKQIKLKYKQLCDKKTNEGDAGEAFGEGYEWGIDLDENGEFKGFTVSENINSVNSLRQQEIAVGMLHNIDRSEWGANEIKTYTLGFNKGLSEYIGINASIGYAMDRQGNVYKVMLASAGSGVGVDNIKVNDLLKKINLISFNISSQYIPGDNLTKNELREKYSGLSITFSKTVMGIQANYSHSVPGDTNVVGWGAGNGNISSYEFAVAYFEPIETGDK